MAYVLNHLTGFGCRRLLVRPLPFCRAPSFAHSADADPRPAKPVNQFPLAVGFTDRPLAMCFPTLPFTSNVHISPFAVVLISTGTAG